MNLRKQLSSYIALNNYVEAIRENTSSVVLTDAIRNGLTGLQLKGSKVKNKPETFLDSVVAKGKTELRLPIERYDVLEYLESTGTQYIDTGYALTTDNFEISGSGLKRQDTASVFFGARNTTSPYIGILEARTSSGLLSFWTGVAWAYFTASINEKYDFKIVCTPKLACTVSCSGFTDKTFTATQTYVNGMNINLFGNNPFASTNSSVVLYAFSIKDNGVLVRDLVPVRRKSDGMLGMYDKVSGTFLTNAGTGEFIAGAVVDTFSVYLPEEYTQLDYIETTNNSYIDTGITPTINAKAEVKFAPVATNITGYWGARADPYRFGCTTFTSGTQFGIGMTNNTWPTNKTAVVFDNIYNCVIANGYASINGTEYVETPVTDFAVTRTFRLGVTSGTASQARYYKCKLWENDLLVFNGIPAKRNSDNVLGMYDTVSGQFFTNRGTGSFIAGPEMIPTPTPTTPTDIWCNNGVLQKSPNLFDKNNYEEIDGYVDGNTGVLTVASGSSNIQRCVIINVKPNTNYQISGILNSNYGTFQTKTIGSVATTYATGNTILTTGPNDKYIIGLVRTTNGAYDYLDTLDIYEINNNARYIVSGTVETLQDSTDLTAKVQTLLASGNYADGQSILDGTITRNIGVKVFDGTENWQNISGYYNISKTDIGSDSTVMPSGSIDIICTHYETISGVPDRTSVNIGGSYVNFRDDNISTLAAWQQYLAEQYAAGTPVIVVFPLATQTTETVSSQKLLKNPVTVTEASIDNLEVTTTETEHTVPTPDYPLDIVCNNGVLKVGPNSFNANSSNITIGYWINNNTGEEVSNDSNFLINGYISVKPNTSYVAYGRRKTDNILSKWNRIAWYDSDKNYISTSPYTSDIIGLGTSPSGAAYARFSSNPTANTVTQDIVDSFNWTFREGTQEYTQFIPYNSIVVEGTPETVTITGKNLFNKNDNLKTGTYHVDNGTWVDNDQFKTLDYIPGKPGVSYTLSAKSTSETGGNAFSVQAWDSTHTNWLGTVASTTAQNVQYASGISPAGTTYLSVSFAPSYRDINTLQLEESSRPTKYEEYYQTSFAPEDLLKLGDYQDVQDVINGIKSKKIGAKVLDGTESWVAGSSKYQGNCYCDNLLTNLKRPAEGDSPAVCTVFPMVEKISDFSVGKGYVSSNPARRVNLWYNDTVANFKQYLAEQYANGTPVIIVYPLADVVEETVESRDVFITSGTNTIERNSEYVSGGGITVGYKKLR